MGFNFNCENICGFLVSAERKRVWQKELDMLKVVLDICKKNDLKIFAIGGTLLGAIRHKGFIPWDDDIDLVMKRSEYEKFINIARTELPSQFFLQYYKTEKSYPNGHLQIRDNNTTCLLKNSYRDLQKHKNCGIFIDVFPFDKLPEDEKQRKKFCKKLKKMRNLLCWKIYGTVGGIKGFVQKLITSVFFLFNSVEGLIEKREKYAIRYNEHINSSIFSPAAFLDYNKKIIWEEIDFKERIFADFEDMKIPVPARYDEILKRQYGDYMQIPENKDGSIHGQAFFDVDKPYTEYQGISKKIFNKLFEQKL